MAIKKFKATVRREVYLTVEAVIDTKSANYLSSLADYEGDKNAAIQDEICERNWTVLSSDTEDEELVSYEEIK